MFCPFGKLERQPFISNAQKILLFRQEDIFGVPDDCSVTRKIETTHSTRKELPTESNMCVITFNSSKNKSNKRKLCPKIQQMAMEMFAMEI